MVSLQGTREKQTFTGWFRTLPHLKEYHHYNIPPCERSEQGAFILSFYFCALYPRNDEGVEN